MHPSLIDIWFDGLEKSSPSMSQKHSTRSRAPFESKQAKLAPPPGGIPFETVRAQERKRPMDEDNSENNGVEPRRSTRIKTRSDQSQSGPVTEIQSRLRGKFPKNAGTNAPQPVLDSFNGMEFGGLENAETILPLRNDPINLANREIPDLPPPSSPTRTGTTKPSSWSSPSRVKGVKREILATLHPAIQFEGLITMKKNWPTHIGNLWKDRISSLVQETKVVPPQLKDRMRQLVDTPAKSQARPDDSSLALTNLYTTDQLAFIWKTVCRVVEKAALQRTQNGPESQWCSFMVAPILDLLHELHRNNDGEPYLEILDISTTSINPITLCPYHETPEVWRILNKKIDFAVGLKILREQEIALKSGTYRYRHPQNHGTSINQTSAWVNNKPMFVNIEVKKKHVPEDPMIQIGAWVAAEFRKRELEGYDMKMPVFAIEIEEDQWNLYIVYASDSTSNDLIFMGPEPMGDTKSLLGVFKILHVLNGLAEWGNTEYRAWFEREVLSKHQTR